MKLQFDDVDSASRCSLEEESQQHSSDLQIFVIWIMTFLVVAKMFVTKR